MSEINRRSSSTAGRDIDGPNLFSMHVGCLWTFGHTRTTGKEQQKASAPDSTNKGWH